MSAQASHPLRIIALAMTALMALPVAGLAPPSVIAHTIEDAAITLPTPIEDAAMAYDGTHAYLFGGRDNDGERLDTIVRYDADTGTTTTMQTTLPSPRSLGAAVWDDGNNVAYIFGGSIDDITELPGYGAVARGTDEILRYDPATDSLDVLDATLPTPRFGMSAVWTGAEAILFGGGTGKVEFAYLSKDILRFDVRDHTISLANAQLERGFFRTMAVWDADTQTAYVFGGVECYATGGTWGLGEQIHEEDTEPGETTEEAPDPTEPQTQSLPIFPVFYVLGIILGVAAIALSLAIAVVNLAIVAALLVTPFAEIHCEAAEEITTYDPVSDTVGLASGTLPLGRWSGAAIHDPDHDQIYIVGGRTEVDGFHVDEATPGKFNPQAAGLVTSDLLRYDIATGTTSKLNRSLDHPLASHQAIWHDDQIHILGGNETLASELGYVIDKDSTITVLGIEFYLGKLPLRRPDLTQQASAAIRIYSIHPDAPRNVQATLVDDHPQISWIPPSDTGSFDVTGYTIERQINDEAWTRLVTLSATASQFLDNDAPHNETVRYRILATNDAGFSPWITTPNTVVPPGHPTAPEGTTVTRGPSPGELTITWSAPLYDGGGAVSGYTIHRGTDPDDVTPIATVTTGQSISDTGLPDATAFVYRITASNELGAGPLSPPVFGTTPDLPAIPDAFEVHAGQNELQLAWTPPLDDGGTTLTNFSVYRHEPGTDTLIATLPSSANTFTDTGIPNNTTRAYRISATNGVGAGPLTPPTNNTTFGILGAPTNVEARADDIGRINIRWLQPELVADGIQHYEIYMNGPDGTATWTTSSLSTFPFVEAGAAYTIQVRAITNLHVGPFSRPVTVTAFEVSQPPSTVTFAASDSDNTLQIDWQPPLDDGLQGAAYARIKQYDIQIATKAAFGGSGVTTFTVGPETQQVTDTGHPANETRWMRIRVVTEFDDFQGNTNVLAESPWSDTLETRARPEAPEVPTRHMTAMPGPGTQGLTIRWAPPSNDGGSSIINHRIYDLAVPGNPSLITEIGPQRIVRLQGLTAGLETPFAVAPVSALGEGPLSTTYAIAAGTPGQRTFTFTDHDEGFFHEPAGSGGIAFDPNAERLSVSHSRWSYGAVANHHLGETWTHVDSPFSVSSAAYEAANTHDQHTVTPLLLHGLTPEGGAGDASISYTSRYELGYWGISRDAQLRFRFEDAAGITRLDASVNIPGNPGRIDSAITYDIDSRVLTLTADPSNGPPISRTVTIGPDDAGFRFTRVGAANGEASGRYGSLTLDVDDIDLQWAIAAQPPVDPEGTTGTQVGEIDLQWNPPSLTGSHDLTGYIIERSIDGGSTYEELRTVGDVTEVTDNTAPLAMLIYYRVRALTDAGPGLPSVPFVGWPNGPASPPIAPTAIGQITNAGTTSFMNVSWDPPIFDGGQAVSGYRVERSTDGENWTLAGHRFDGERYFHDHTPEALADVVYRVSATHAQGVGPSTGNVQGLWSRPQAAPALVDAHILGDTTFVTWKGQEDPLLLPVTGYRVFRADETGAQLHIKDTVTDDGVLDALIEGGSTYTYTVCSLSAHGLGDCASTDPLLIDVIPETELDATAFDGFTATAGTPSDSISFDAEQNMVRFTVSENESRHDAQTRLLDVPLGHGRDAFIFQGVVSAEQPGRFDDVALLHLEQAGSNHAFKLEYDARNIEAGQLPALRVYTQRDDGSTLLWDSILFDPAEPHMVHVAYVPAEETFRVMLLDGSGVAKGVVEADAPGTFTFTHWTMAVDSWYAQPDPLEIRLTDARLQWWRVPAAPEANAVPTTQRRAITLEIEASDELHDGQFKGFHVERRDPATGAIEPVTLLDDTTTTVTDTGLLDRTVYDYFIRARSTRGLGEAHVLEARTLGAPEAPATLDGQLTPDGQGVILSWSPPLDDWGSPVTGYEILRSDDGTQPVALLSTTTTNNMTYEDNPEKGGVYRYAVRAVNEIGGGPTVATATFDLVQPPSAPTSILARPGDRNLEVRVSWGTASDDGGSPVTAYKLYSGSRPDFESMDLRTTRTGRTFTDTSPNPFGPTYYRVLAVNAAGLGEPTEAACAVYRPAHLADPNPTGFMSCP